MRALEKCAHACVQASVVSTPPRSWQLLLSGRETVGKNNQIVVVEFMSEKKTAAATLTWKQNSQVDLDNVELLAHADCFQRPFWNFVVLTFCLTTFRLATHMSVNCANFGPEMTNSTMLGLVTSLKMMMMVVGVLNFAVPQSAPPSEN